jgi:predicted AAA+ superfamily ATPase
VVERDIRDLADIEGRTAVPRLLKIIAQRSGEVQNISALGREARIPHTTLTRYIALLEAVFLVHSVPAWETGLGHRTIQAPRLFLLDPGVENHLKGSPGTLLTLAAAELKKQAAWSDAGLKLVHFRSVRRYECPLVLEDAQGRIIAFTLTEEAAAGPEDFRPLEFLADLAGGRFRFGFALHTGARAHWRDDRLAALPITALWA